MDRNESTTWELYAESVNTTLVADDFTYVKIVVGFLEVSKCTLYSTYNNTLKWIFQSIYPSNGCTTVHTNTIYIYIHIYIYIYI